MKIDFFYPFSKVGDQLLDVCGINMRNCTYNQAERVLGQCGNSITMHVQYNPDSKYSRIFKRAHFRFAEKLIIIVRFLSQNTTLFSEAIAVLPAAKTEADQILIPVHQHLVIHRT